MSPNAIRFEERVTIPRGKKPDKFMIPKHFGLPILFTGSAKNMSVFWISFTGSAEENGFKKNMHVTTINFILKCFHFVNSVEK